MLITNFTYNDFCNLITSVLDSSFNISTTKINTISDFTNYIDIEFRKIIWTDYNYDNNYNINDLLQMRKSALCIVQSALEFTTIVFSFPKEISNDILVIGPFLEIEPSDEYIISLLKKNNLPYNLRKTFSTYYKSLPIADSMKVIYTLHTVLGSFISDYDPSSMYYVDFSESKPKLADYNYNDDSQFYIQYHKKYKSCLDDIFKYMRSGKDTTQILNDYIELTGILKGSSIDKIKNNLYILNTQLESELLKETISPAQVRDLSLKNQLEIETESSRIKLMKIPYKMLRKYSNLISNHNLKGYSYTVRSAIEYINLNLQSNLSLSTISSAIGKNASFLSSQFKKETGNTVTRYIQERRIEESIRMLSYTNMTIQEISHLVGIDDLSWFSKLFKSITNVSPTKYRENMYKSKKDAN